MKHNSPMIATRPFISLVIVASPRLYLWLHLPDLYRSLSSPTPTVCRELNRNPHKPIFHHLCNCLLLCWDCHHRQYNNMIITSLKEAKFSVKETINEGAAPFTGHKQQGTQGWQAEAVATDQLRHEDQEYSSPCAHCKCNDPGICALFVLVYLCSFLQWSRTRPWWRLSITWLRQMKIPPAISRKTMGGKYLFFWRTSQYSLFVHT